MKQYEQAVKNGKILATKYNGLEKRSRDLRDQIADLCIKVERFAKMKVYVNDIGLHYPTVHNWIQARRKTTMLEKDLEKDGKKVDLKVIDRIVRRKDVTKNMIQKDLMAIYNEEIQKSKEDIELVNNIGRIKTIRLFLSGTDLKQLDQSELLNMAKLVFKCVELLNKFYKSREKKPDGMVRFLSLDT